MAASPTAPTAPPTAAVLLIGNELLSGKIRDQNEKVEAALEITPARKETLGGCARVIARGCDALGWKHAPLARNAPGCDGQAVCCFGCPTDAKRSTNVSYVPDYWKFDAMVAYKVTPNSTLQLNVYNLFDTMYYDGIIASDGGRAVPGAGITAMLTLNYRL